MGELTPMMKQYVETKKKYPDALLFFRLGDFYEMFFEDAITTSRELEIALTKRECGLAEKAPMCGVPHHVAETYISRLVDKGYKVAVCDQVEDPALAKGLVKREVVRVVTPGTILDTNLLSEKSNNFLASIFVDSFGAGICYVDHSTGEMLTTEFIGEQEITSAAILDELGKIMPSELIINSVLAYDKKTLNTIKNKIGPFINIIDDEDSDITVYSKQVNDFFKKYTEPKIELQSKIYSLISAARLIKYLKSTQFSALEHITDIQYYESEQYMLMDISTRTNLEIHETMRRRDKKGALITILDKTKTAMGGRLLKKWLERPLIDTKLINNRLDMVEYLTKNLFHSEEIKEILQGVYDIERLSSKITNGNCNARDMIALKQSIKNIPNIKTILLDTGQEQFLKLQSELDPLKDVYKLIEDSMIEEPPISLKDGGLIKRGFNADLDGLRESSVHGKEWLSKLEKEEKEKTGIKALKIGYNRVTGYYIEVRKTSLNMVPDDYIRKQTLANSERYYTEELKEIENKILGAEGKSIEIEYEIFQQIRELVKKEITRLQKTSRLLAIIDVILSFSIVANANNFVRPSLNKKGIIDIKDGRHPVVEATIEHQLFVPNDSYMDTRHNMVHIITGPNMAGKSTFMRQIAIITLLAQIGSYVPAKEADIGIVDRIFTRIGASDNLSQGESTFMVEMNEVSNILKHSTKNSLLILDEVGRGTSTYDGLSIAWAVVEDIALNIKAKTLFATHYHELTQLESKVKGIKNYTITAEEQGDDIIFLRKVIEGATNQSYGIQVAKLAGVNREVIDRANEVLSLIEGSHNFKPYEETDNNNAKQLNLNDYKKDFFLDRVKNININELTPVDALNVLNSLVSDAKKLKE